VKLYVIRKRIEMCRASDLSEKKYFTFPAVDDVMVTRAVQPDRPGFYLDLSDERCVGAGSVHAI